MPSGRARRHGSFPTTADMGIWATAPDAASLYEELIAALVGAMTDRRRVRPREERTVTVSGEDPTALAVQLLSELVVLFQVEGFLPRTATVRLSGRPARSLTARLAGEPFDEGRHPRRIEVKAVTWHRALFDAAAGRARFILDI